MNGGIYRGRNLRARADKFPRQAEAADKRAVASRPAGRNSDKGLIREEDAYETPRRRPRPASSRRISGEMSTTLAANTR